MWQLVLDKGVESSFPNVENAKNVLGAHGHKL